MSGSSKKSLKAALALGGGLVTVGLMAAMLTDDDGPPEDVVDGVQSTMNGLVDKAGGAVAAMAQSVGDAVKASLGGVLKTAAPDYKELWRELSRLEGRFAFVHARTKSCAVRHLDSLVPPDA